MNSRVLVGFASIGATLSLMAGATFAAFTSQNVNSGNTFGVGNLVLNINGQAPVSTGVFSVTNATPGASFTQKMTMSNTGTINASSVNVVGISLSGDSDLQSKLTLQLFNDADNSGTFTVGDTNLGAAAHINDAVWTGFVLPGVALPAAGTYNLAATLTLDADATNAVQGKTAGFNITFQANQ